MPLKDGSYKGPHWATRRSLLEMLKMEGALSSQQMSTALGISSMAVRQHMQELQRLGEVAAESRSSGKGRPTKYWTLTPQAERHFPDRHRDLMLDLIKNVRSALGESALNRLLDEREEQQVNGYAARLADCQQLGERIALLARIRGEEGYMAGSRQLPNGDWELAENHCPICSAAEACSGLCSRERAVFERVLGGCEVERVEHLLAGARRCVYRIRPKPGPL